MIAYFPQDNGLPKSTQIDTVFDLLRMCVYGDEVYVFSSAKDYLEWGVTKDRNCIALHVMIDQHQIYKVPGFHVLPRKD